MVMCMGGIEGAFNVNQNAATVLSQSNVNPSVIAGYDDSRWREGEDIICGFAYRLSVALLPALSLACDLMTLSAYITLSHFSFQRPYVCFENSIGAKNDLTLW